MKFGHQLKTSLYPEWVFYYLAYDSLKAELKTRLTKNQGGWTEDDESAFAELLEKELDKVYSFQKVKSGEIMRRLQAPNRKSKRLFNRMMLRMRIMRCWKRSCRTSLRMFMTWPSLRD